MVAVAAEINRTRKKKSSFANKVSTSFSVFMTWLQFSFLSLIFIPVPTAVALLGYGNLETCIALGPDPDILPVGVKLIQPRGRSQLLLYDHANCLAVDAYLRMCKVKFEVGAKRNAEFISPTGNVPVFKYGNQVLSELDPVISFLSTKGISLTRYLTASHIAEMRSLMALINTRLVNAELHITWRDKEVCDSMSWPLYGSLYPFPLNFILPYKKRSQILNRLKILGWYDKTKYEVLNEIWLVCHTLSESLQNKPYFFGGPTELDALAYGHLFALMITPLPDDEVANLVKSFENLVLFCEGVEDELFHKQGCLTVQGHF